MLANPHLHQAAEKLGKRMPSHFYTLQLLQRNYQIAKKAHTIYAFGILEQDQKRVKGGTGWTVQLAMDQGKPVYLFDIPSQSWYRSDHYYQVNENAATLVTGSQFVPWGPKKPTLHQSSAIVGSRDVDENTRALFKPYSTAPSVSPRTLINYVWNSKTFICNVLVFSFGIVHSPFLVFIFPIVHSFFPIVNRRTLHGKEHRQLFVKKHPLFLIKTF